MKTKCARFSWCLFTLLSSPSITLASAAPSYLRGAVCELHTLLGERFVDGLWATGALQSVIRMPKIPIIHMPVIHVGDVLEISSEDGLPKLWAVASIRDSKYWVFPLEMNPRLRRHNTSSPFSDLQKVEMGRNVTTYGAIVGTIRTPTKPKTARPEGELIEGYLRDDIIGARIEWKDSAIHVGDVISSREFAFASQAYGNGIENPTASWLEMDSHRFGVASLDENESVIVRSLVSVTDGGTVDLTAYDATRASAPFLILGRGYEGQSPTFKALRLDLDGTMHEPLEVLSFSYRSSYSHSVQSVIRWGNAFK